LIRCICDLDGFRIHGRIDLAPQVLVTRGHAEVDEKSANQPEIEAESFDNPFDLKVDEKLVTVD